MKYKKKEVDEVGQRLGMVGRDKTGDAMTQEAEHQTAAQRHEAVRAHYLSLPGKTEAGWAAVTGNPAKYNRVWNHLLGMPASDKPPPINFKTGELRQ